MRFVHTLLLLAAASTPVLASEFPGGELLVADPGGDVVTRFDAQHANVGSIGSAATILNPSAVAFGPDGLLYVASGLNTVVVFDADGGVVRTITDALLIDPSALAFDARGNLLAASRFQDRVLVFDATGAKIGEIKSKATDLSQLNAPNGLAVGPDGHVYTVDAENNVVYEFDAAGTQLRTAQVGCGNGADMRGIAIGWNGHLFVCCSDDNRVKELDATLSVVHTIGDGTTAVMDDPSAIAFGADDLLYVASADRIDRFDRTGAKVDSIATGAVSDPSALAFSPWRFGVDLKGDVAVDGAGLFDAKSKFDKATNAGAVLSLHPGSSVVQLTLVDDPQDSEDLADLFGATTLVFHGADSATAPSGKQRHLAAFSVPGFALDGGMIAIGLQLTGKTGSDGVFRAKSLKGDLTAGAGSATLRLSVTSVKRLNAE